MRRFVSTRLLARRVSQRGAKGTIVFPPISLTLLAGAENQPFDIREQMADPLRQTERGGRFAVASGETLARVLGCTTDLPDVSCRQFLDNLIGLFRFYNGAVCRAYGERTKEDLDQDWDRYATHLQRNTSDLHRIFNSLWALDKTKVTFLPPDLTAKVLLQETEAAVDPKVRAARDLRVRPERLQSRGEDTGANDGNVLLGGDPSSLARMVLYVHRVRGLVLCLVAEEPFAESGDCVEDVFHSSLASLNGLEVHLKETLPKDGLPAPKATYAFAHYDAVQKVLA
ncbi:hypothetical protein JD844_015280, partial [Phrynosoma platyrhinos]